MRTCAHPSAMPLWTSGHGLLAGALSQSAGQQRTCSSRQNTEQAACQHNGKLNTSALLELPLRLHVRMDAVSQDMTVACEQPQARPGRSIALLNASTATLVASNPSGLNGTAWPQASSSPPQHNRLLQGPTCSHAQLLHVQRVQLQYRPATAAPCAGHG